MRVCVGGRGVMLSMVEASLGRFLGYARNDMAAFGMTGLRLGMTWHDSSGMARLVRGAHR